MKKTIMFSIVIGFLSVSCGSNDSATSQRNGKNQIKDDAEFSLSQAHDSFCPTGFTIDTTHWLCVNSKEAVGPFSPSMVQRCKELGGGNVACEGDKWAVGFARRLRGTGVCAAGTTHDKTLDECVAGESVFGPFRKSMVAECEKIGGGKACQGMRWSKTLTQSIKKSLGLIGGGVEQPTQALATPYLYQYRNVNEPGATCGVTSAAMLLNYFRTTKVTPDQLYNRYGKRQGQSPAGLAELYRREGLISSSSWTATRAQLRKHLDAGRPVVVHGDWTASGHIIVLTGYTSKGWIANDPAGDHGKCYDCSAVSGHKVFYSFGGLTDRLMGADGDVWMSTADTKPFDL